MTYGNSFGGDISGAIYERARERVEFDREVVRAQLALRRRAARLQKAQQEADREVTVKRMEMEEKRFDAQARDWKQRRADEIAQREQRRADEDARWRQNRADEIARWKYKVQRDEVEDRVKRDAERSEGDEDAFERVRKESGKILDEKLREARKTMADAEKEMRKLRKEWEAAVASMEGRNPKSPGYDRAVDKARAAREAYDRAVGEYDVAGMNGDVGRMERAKKWWAAAKYSPDLKVPEFEGVADVVSGDVVPVDAPAAGGGGDDVSHVVSMWQEKFATVSGSMSENERRVVGIALKALGSDDEDMRKVALRLLNGYYRRWFDR